jgi:O-methyltransferase involved in polyketide biosynthesis
VRSKIEAQLGDIQETLLIPLWSRAVELQHPDPILRDQKSAEIMQAIDYNFDKFAEAKTSQIGCCLRGLVLDQWVKTHLETYPQGPVIELGAGLNTRFERVDNGQVCWFDLDLPDAMDLRRRFFEQSDRRRLIAASALDTSWVETVKQVSAGPGLFLAEGVLMYLAEAQVQQLFANLAQHFPGCWLAFDSMAPLMTGRRHQAVKHTAAAFDWAIADIHRIETWDTTYRIQEICRFSDLPKYVAPQHYRRFSWLNRVLFSLPVMRDLYRITLIQLG